MKKLPRYACRQVAAKNKLKQTRRYPPNDDIILKEEKPDHRDHRYHPYARPGRGKSPGTTMATIISTSRQTMGSERCGLDRWLAKSIQRAKICFYIGKLCGCLHPFVNPGEEIFFEFRLHSGNETICGLFSGSISFSPYPIFIDASPPAKRRELRYLRRTCFSPTGFQWYNRSSERLHV